MVKIGNLFVVATPIGNMGDITLRAIETLKQSDLILCEDTRVSKKLLSKYNIDVPLISFHSYNEHKTVQKHIDQILNGKRISLISDAGTPSISDPGFLIVRESINNDIEINKSDFYNLPFLVQLKIITNQCFDTRNSFSKTDVREIKDLLRKNLTGSSKKINDKTILIDRNSLIIYKNMKNDIFCNVEAGKEFKGKNFTFSWDFNKAPKTIHNDNEVEFIDASKINDNLVIRSVRDSDSFMPLGMKGNKKVSKFLKDKNLSFIKRKESLVVCNQDEIIWVAGYQLSEKYKIHKNSIKIAKLNFSRN